ncbi:RHS repeat-associated core domain-containing protein [Pseudomonas sichuanensis]|uniref:RHS repeat-associated core domain-containing protein n=1 Tax=Pseudomonas sichuanensis TaxID=2213015 RepID=UPI000DA6570C
MPTSSTPRPMTTLLATNTPGSVLWYLADRQSKTISYTAFGHRLPGLASSLGFNGQYLDQPSGCYLLGNGYRVYHPLFMRFNSPDSLSPFGSAGVNAYAYCAADPINRTDPTGHMFKLFKVHTQTRSREIPNAVANSQYDPQLPSFEYWERVHPERMTPHNPAADQKRASKIQNLNDRIARLKVKRDTYTGARADPVHYGIQITNASNKLQRLIAEGPQLTNPHVYTDEQARSHRATFGYVYREDVNGLPDYASVIRESQSTTEESAPPAYAP